jgi:hypothetical protein
MTQPTIEAERRREQRARDGERHARAHAGAQARAAACGLDGGHFPGVAHG